MSSEEPDAPSATETVVDPSAEDAGTKTSPPQRAGSGFKRTFLALLRRPVVRMLALVAAALIAGYAIGAVRLASRQRDWQTERRQLEGRIGSLESSLGQLHVQEVSYRVLVSVSRVVVNLYDRNFGAAAEELRAVRAAVTDIPRLAGSELEAKLQTFQADLEELSRRIEEMSRTARDTMRDIEREVTRELFPAGS